MILTLFEFNYGFTVRDLMFMDDFMMFNLEGSWGIMSMNYSTQGLKEDTSCLKIVQLIGFMQNYEHEILNSRTSWVTCNSPIIRNIISIVIRTQYLELRDTTRFNDTQFIKFMRKLWTWTIRLKGQNINKGTHVYDSSHSHTY